MSHQPPPKEGGPLDLPPPAVIVGPGPRGVVHDRPPRRWWPFAAVGGVTMLTVVAGLVLSTRDAADVPVPPREDELVLAPVEAAPPGPTMGDLCHPDELEVSTSQVQDGGADSVVEVRATNIGQRQCRVESFPSVRLLSDDTDLSVLVDVRSMDPVTLDEVSVKPVWLTKGEQAMVQVWWPSWGAAADLDAQQVLELGVGGSVERVRIPEGFQWDLVRSAAAMVSPWQPVKEP